MASEEDQNLSESTEKAPAPLHTDTFDLISTDIQEEDDSEIRHFDRTSVHEEYQFLFGNSTDISIPYRESDIESSDVNYGIEQIEISKGFNSYQEGLLKKFSSKLIEHIEAIEELRGVLYGIRIYSFKSLEDELSLIKIELKVPGISGKAYNELWSRYSDIMGKTIKEYVKIIKPTSKEGREFRRISRDISESIGTFR
jgi:hypothetical protein